MAKNMKNTSSSGSNSKNLSTLLALVSTAGAVVSGILTQHFYEVREGTAAFQSFCNLGSQMNCDVVAASPYAELMFGLPLSSFAGGWFVGLAIVAWVARSPFWRREATRVAFAMAAFATLMSLAYFAVMAFVLKTYCLFCLVTDAIGIAALVITLLMKPDFSPRPKADWQKWRTLGGTVIGALAVTVFVLSLMRGHQISSDVVEEMAENVVQSPSLSVASGPEFPTHGAGPSAPITIVEFSDYQCAFCRRGAMVLNSVINAFPGQVRVVVRAFPLDPSCNRSVQHSGHPAACEAAKAAPCAQSHGKFQDVYETLFEKQTSLAPGRIAELVKGTGVDLATLQGCMASPEVNSRIGRDIEEGMQLGVKSTPTYFINGHKIEGAYPVPVWNSVVKKLLARGGSGSNR